jgi:hypothetical protein
VPLPPSLCRLTLMITAQSLRLRASCRGSREHQILQRLPIYGRRRCCLCTPWTCTKEWHGGFTKGRAVSGFLMLIDLMLTFNQICQHGFHRRVHANQRHRRSTGPVVRYRLSMVAEFRETELSIPPFHAHPGLDPQ